MKNRIFQFAMFLAASCVFSSCGGPTPNTNNANANVNTSVSSPTPSAAAIEADIKKMIADLSTALSTNDTVALDKIWADDYEFVTPDGQIQTKSERLESIRSGELKMESITFDDVHVRSYGDAAVVDAKVTQKSTNKGKDTSGTSTATIVFVKMKEGWRIVHGAPSGPLAAAKTATTTTTTTATPAKTPAANKPPPSPVANANANKPAPTMKPKSNANTNK
jgi:ketosteroid isomerase-like protein